MALLGAILSNNKAYHRVSDYLLPEHFADNRHGQIYEAIARLIDHGQIADPVVLKNFFEQDGRLDGIGGTEYLARLAASVVTIINAGDYGLLIYGYWLKRALIAAGEDIVNAAYDEDLGMSAHEIVDAAMSSLISVMERGALSAGGTDIKTSVWGALRRVEAAYKTDGAITGLETGLKRLDSVLGGFHRGDLIVLAGRPGLGKSDAATNIAAFAAGAGERILFFSLEMTHEEISHRLMARDTGISAHAQRRGAIDHDEMMRLIEARDRIAQLSLVIDDTASLNAHQIKARARRYQAQGPISLIIVDHLQRMAKMERRSSRYEHITDSATSMKNLAKSLNVPVLLLSQLSRDVEGRENKRPDLPDLRESGAIEQEADVVLFLYRDSYYLAKVHKDKRDLGWHDQWETGKDKLEIIIAKQRMGPIITIEVLYKPAESRLGDIPRRSPAEDADQAEISL